MRFGELRKKIDLIDEKILGLLNQRCDVVKDIGRLKLRSGKKIYVPEREKFVLDRLEKLNKGPIPSKALRAIYREVMSAAIALEKPLHIGYFGQEASFTHLAAHAKFGHSAEYVSKSGISDVFNDVEAERIDYGVVPIENSTEGVINHTLDMLINSSVKICAEINMRIHQRLLSKIEDNPCNTTRFLVIGKQEPAATGGDKTSICYAVKDRVGVLYDSLVPFKKNKITLTMIESRPSKKRNWEYFFFVDIKGHIKDKALSEAVGELGEMCQFVKVLGSYPQSREVV
jgi:chorismate mutase-like protein